MEARDKLAPEIDNLLQTFVRDREFYSKGGVITDLDGTAVHEEAGRTYIPPPVEFGLREIYRQGRPVVLNSLRFPLSVMRTFGKEWIAISGAPIPIVSMNGTQLGLVSTDDAGELAFEEITAFPLAQDEIDDVFKGVQNLLDNDIKEVLLFYYPRDWRMGEIIWTPVAENVLPVKEKYKSASSVTTVELAKLREQMAAEDICMIFLLIERQESDLMAYQHSRPSSFFTHRGIDKLFGAVEIAKHLNFDLNASVGAGDTPMDIFLNGVGLAAHVGPMNLDFRGLHSTIKLRNSFELGDVLFRIADLQREVTA